MSITLSLPPDTLAALQADADAQHCSIEQAAARCFTDLYAGIDAEQVKDAFRLMGELPALCDEMRQQKKEIAVLHKETAALQAECRRLRGETFALSNGLPRSEKIIQ